MFIFVMQGVSDSMHSQSKYDNIGRMEMLSYFYENLPMRTLFIVGLILTVLTFADACSKKHSDDTTSFIYGDWIVTSTHYIAKKDGVVYMDTLEHLPAGRRIIHFGSDMSFTDNDTGIRGGYFDGTYTLDTALLTFYFNFNNGTSKAPYPYHYRLSGNQTTFFSADTQTVPEGVLTYADTQVIVKR